MNLSLEPSVIGMHAGCDSMFEVKPTKLKLAAVVYARMGTVVYA